MTRLGPQAGIEDSRSGSARAKAPMVTTWLSMQIRLRMPQAAGGVAFITEPGAFGGVMIDAIEEETGILARLSTSGGTSDARFIKDYCPVLEFGPLNGTIHQVNEAIAIADLRNLAQIYRTMIEAYLGRAPR